MSNMGAGKYRARIVGAALGESEAKHTPQVEITIELITAMGEDGRTYPVDAKKIVYMALTENTLGTTSSPGWVLETLTAFGFRGPSFSNLECLVGKEVDALCKEEEYDGKMNEKWSIFRPFNGPKNPAWAWRRSCRQPRSRLRRRNGRPRPRLSQLPNQ